MFLVRFLEGRSSSVDSGKNEEPAPLECPSDEEAIFLQSCHDLEKIDQLSSLLVRKESTQCSSLFRLWNGMVTKENNLADSAEIKEICNIDLNISLSESYMNDDDDKSTKSYPWGIFRFTKADTKFLLADSIIPWHNVEFFWDKIFYELNRLQTEKSKIVAKSCKTKSNSNNMMSLPFESEDLNFQEWCNLLNNLNQISTFIENVSIPEYSKRIYDLDEKRNQLVFQFFYINQFRKCYGLLQDVQKYLQSIDIKNCIKSFNELYDFLHDGCLQNNSCFFVGETKNYLINKMETLFHLIFSLVVKNLQSQLEECNFGTLGFKSFYETLSESRIEEIFEHMSSLNFCQDLYELLVCLKGEEQREAIGPWLAFALASLPILNFDILFLHPSSSLSSLKYVEEPFQFMTTILLTHTRFLQKCFQRFKKINIGSSIIITFVHILSEHIQRFTLSQLKYIKEVRINKEGKLSNIFIQEFIRSIVDQAIEFIHILETYDIECVTKFLLFPQQFIKDDSSFLFSLPVCEAYKNFMIPQHIEDPIKNNRKEFTLHEELEIFGLSPSDFFFNCFDALSVISGQTSFYESLLGCIIVYHQFDLSLLWNSLEDIHLMQTCYLTFSDKCTAYTELSNEDKMISNHMQRINFSQKVRIVLEICLTLCQKVQIIMKVPSCGSLYTKMVFRPLVEKMWDLLRSAWNEINYFLMDLKKCCFILETFQIILNCVDDSVSFPPSIYLSNEIKEWKRILLRAYNILAESILETTGLPNLHDTLKFLEYCQVTDQVIELNDLKWSSFYIKDVKDHLKCEPGSSHLLNIIAEAFCRKTIEMSLCPTPLLYLNNRKCLAYFGRKVMETFIEKIEPQPYFQKLQDIITLLEVSDNEARQFIYEMEQENEKKEADNLEPSDDNNDVPAMRPFLGVQLVMKAEKFIKESTHQMLSTTKFNNPLTSNLNIVLNSPKSSELAQSFFIYKIKTLSYEECYTVLKRRREFAFSVSHGFSSK